MPADNAASADAIRAWLPPVGTSLGISWFTLRHLPWLAEMLARWTVVPLELRAFQAENIAGWGKKYPARMARQLATTLKKPFWTLEDGFYRSAGLGKSGAWPVSYVMDDLGIHFDAASPSRLETILMEEDLQPLHAEAQACRQTIVQNRLTKYNHLPDQRPDLAPGRGRRILLADQVAGDHSIAGALAIPGTFESMLREALEVEGAHIVIRAHPDVTAGHAKGYLPVISTRERVTICHDNISPHAILDEIDEVWTVSSQLGFDALLRDIPVRCFGAAFYAGWGLTRDTPHTSQAKASLQRRQAAAKPRCLDDLIAASLLRYCLYYDPVRQRETSLDAALTRLVSWRRHLTGWQGPTLATGISGHKRPVLRSYCAAPGGTVRFGQPHLPQRRHLVWGTLGEARALAGEGNSSPLIRVEDGFVRSIGLGSQKHFPLSLCFDHSGIYYDATRPSDLETILQERNFTGAELERARMVRRAIVAGNVSKYNLPQSPVNPQPGPAPGQIKIVAFGQVPDDQSLTLGLIAEPTNMAFLDRVRQVNPQAFIIFREHPDLVAGKRSGATDLTAAARLANVVATGEDASSWIDFADEVHVRTSLAGFEALLRHKRVVCHGMPFYSGWGLTQDTRTCARRTRKRTLDELVAAALLEYPVYLDPRTKLPMEVEDAIAWIVANRK